MRVPQACLPVSAHLPSFKLDQQLADGEAAARGRTAERTQRVPHVSTLPCVLLFLSLACVPLSQACLPVSAHLPSFKLDQQLADGEAAAWQLQVHAAALQMVLTEILLGAPAQTVGFVWLASVASIPTYAEFAPGGIWSEQTGRGSTYTFIPYCS